MFRKNDHWTPQEHEETLRCPSFRELAEVGLQILADFKRKNEGKKVALLSGPMTTGGLGNCSANMHVFGSCIDVARKYWRGVAVFNQLPFQDAMVSILKLPAKPTCAADHTYPQTILDDFYWPIMRSGHISCMSFLPTWKTSHGSMQEFDKAVEFGIEIYGFEPVWYAEAMLLSRPFLVSLQTAT